MRNKIYLFVGAPLEVAPDVTELAFYIITKENNQTNNIKSYTDEL